MGTGVDREVHIWYNDAGRILAWGCVGSDTPVRLQAEPLAAPGQAVLTTHVAEDVLPTLHETHRIDSGKQELQTRTKED